MGQIIPLTLEVRDAARQAGGDHCAPDGASRGQRGDGPSAGVVPAPGHPLHGVLENGRQPLVMILRECAAACVLQRKPSADAAGTIAALRQRRGGLGSLGCAANQLDEFDGIHAADAAPHLTALLACYADAVDRPLTFFRTGARKLSWDETWCLSMLFAARDQQVEMLCSLATFRLPRAGRRAAVHHTQTCANALASADSRH